MAFDDLDSLPDPVAPPSLGSNTRAEITREQFLALAARHLPCGVFTLTVSDGSVKRFRVRLERGKFLCGQRTLQRYCKLPDSDNNREREWETIGVVGPSGINMFKVWRNAWEGKWAGILWNLAAGKVEPGYSVEIEPTCWMTGRKLTQENISVGLCATWRKRFGL